MSRPAPFDAELEDAVIDFRLWKQRAMAHWPPTEEEVLKLVEGVEHYMPIVSRTERTLKHVRLLMSAGEGVDGPWVERSFKESRRLVDELPEPTEAV